MVSKKMNKIDSGIDNSTLFQEGQMFGLILSLDRGITMLEETFDDMRKQHIEDVDYGILYKIEYQRVSDLKTELEATLDEFQGTTKLTNSQMKDLLRKYEFKGKINY